MKIKEVINFLEDLAPVKLAESWDNVGLHVGNEDNEITKVLLALDATDEVVDEAIEIGANLIVTHHPMIFKAVKNINTSNPLGNKIIKLIENNISVYVAHTNLDSSVGGTSEVLAELLKLENIKVLEPLDVDNNCGLGRTGTLAKEETLSEILQSLKDTGKFDYINYSPDYEGLDKVVKKIGLCTGSLDDSMVFKAKSDGCDIYISGDLKYHSAQLAKNLGIAIVDIGHYCSENIVFESLSKRLSSEFRNTEFIISKVNAQTIYTF